MSQKKVKKLRKELGMTAENHRAKEYGVSEKKQKIAYFRNALGDLQSQIVDRVTVVNKNLNFYRKQKKLSKQGLKDE